MKSDTLSKLGHMGSKTRSQGQINGKPCEHSKGQFWPDSHQSWSECLSLWNLGPFQNWVTWGQKLGHRVKWKENLVNTVEVTVWTRFSSISVRMIVSMKSGSFLKLGYLGSKTRSWGQIKRKPCEYSEFSLWKIDTQMSDMGPSWPSCLAHLTMNWCGWANRIDGCPSSVRPSSVRPSVVNNCLWTL